jgi:transglutaminase-like putative cysteine protease
VKLDQQIPRNALVWILLAQLFLLLPHLTRLPAWIFVLYTVTAGWRIMVYRGQWSFPSRWIRYIFAIGGFTGVSVSFGTMLGLEPTVALLLTAFTLKLMELCEHKDAYLVIFLGFFVCLTEFLFSQELWITLYNTFCVLVLITALVALHRPGYQRFSLAPLRRSALYLAQAFPLMVVLFLIFPRLPPLWAVPIKSNAAKMGVSDYMSPGDIASLSTSDEVAFRAEFTDEIPPVSKMYWRGLVFSKFDGRTWLSLKWRDIPTLERRENPPEGPLENGLQYTVVVEPTQQKWLYSLRYVGQHSRNVARSNDFRVVSPIEIQDQYRYSATSYPDVVIDLELSDWRREVDLKIPVRGNLRARALASSIRAEATNDRDYANRVLDHFNREKFVYTLNPALLGDSMMDDFLFETRQGFCEHYASAFVFLMRSQGVPARVVVGYLGGEVNPVNKTVIVHQFDAHAWAEIWLEGEGWVRADPTGAVSPDRIEWGLERAMAEEGSFLAGLPLSPIHYRDVAWLNQLRLRYDAITYAWQLMVISYDTDDQYQILDDLLGEISIRSVATLVLGVGLLSLLPVLIGIAWRARPSQSTEVRAYQRFCRKLTALGLVRSSGEAPRSFAQRACKELPRLEKEIMEVTRCFENVTYTPGYSETHQKELRRAVRRFVLISG